MRLIQHLITEYAHGHPVRRHLVNVTDRDVSARAWNAEIRSTNAFRRFSDGFFDPAKPDPALAFGVQFKEDFDRENAILAHENVPIVEHATIFVFYDAVGFDYKRKKFR